MKFVDVTKFKHLSTMFKKIWPIRLLRVYWIEPEVSDALDQALDTR